MGNFTTSCGSNSKYSIFGVNKSYAKDLEVLQKKNTTKGKIAIIEVRGGTDKNDEGHRKDTVPILKELIQLNWYSVAVYYSDDHYTKLLSFLSSFNAVLPRINPGEYTNYTSTKFQQFLSELKTQYNVNILTNYDSINKMGKKDILYTLRNTKFGLSDTHLYKNATDFKYHFKKNIKLNQRVIKKNGGSQGEGVYVCKWLNNKKNIEIINCNDNSKCITSINKFIDSFDDYLDNKGVLIDQRFLPRIIEGEIRILMMFDNIIEVVHKKPQDNSVVATLKSGAKYVNYNPCCSEYKGLCNDFRNNLKSVLDVLGVNKNDLPTLWTADFILGDKDKNGNDSYYLGEINCSCVGITRQLHLCKSVASSINSILSN